MGTNGSSKITGGSGTSHVGATSETSTSKVGKFAKKIVRYSKGGLARAAKKAIAPARAAYKHTIGKGTKIVHEKVSAAQARRTEAKAEKNDIHKHPKILKWKEGVQDVMEQIVFSAAFDGRIKTEDAPALQSKLEEIFLSEFGNDTEIELGNLQGLAGSEKKKGIDAFLEKYDMGKINLRLNLKFDAVPKDQ